MTLTLQTILFINHLAFFFIQFCEIKQGDEVAQLVERRTQDWMTRGSNPVRSIRNTCESCFRVKNIVLTRCPVYPTPVCIRMHNNDYVRTLKIL